MDPEQACQHAQAKILEVRALLRDPHPQALNDCESGLAEVAALLRPLIEATTREQGREWTPPAKRSLLDLRASARDLARQIEYASMLCRGWIHQRFGTLYTSDGFPEPVTSGSVRSFEG
jgi:hypothetical protein